MLDHVLSFLGKEPVRYWCVAGVSLAVCLVLAWRPGSPPRATRTGTLIFIFSLFACLTAFRWPVLFITDELTVDESQMIAGAMTLRHDPIYWRSVDAQTVGPLSVYALMAPLEFFKTQPYATAHGFGLLLIGASIVINYYSIRLVFAEQIARLAILPLLACVAFMTDPGLVHYTTELLLLGLISAALAAALRFFTAGGNGWLFVSGLMLGAVPFAKPQGVIMAFWIGICVAWLAERREPGRRGRPALILLGGLAIVPAWFVASGMIFGVWREMIVSYFTANVSYVKAGYAGNARMLALTAWKLLATDTLGAYFCTTLAVTALALKAPRPRDLQAWWWWVAGGLGISAVASIIIPGRAYEHYFLLLLPPSVLITAGSLARLNEASKSMMRAGWIMLLCGGICVPAVWRLGHGTPNLSRYAQDWETPRASADPLIMEAKRWVKPGEPLGMWGYETALYVHTRCRQATRESNTTAQAIPSPEQDYFRRRYLADLRKSHPRVFVDTTPAHRRGYGFDDFPELQHYLAENYRFYVELGHRRLYLAKEVFPDSHP